LTLGGKIGRPTSMVEVEPEKDVLGSKIDSVGVVQEKKGSQSIKKAIIAVPEL